MDDHLQSLKVTELKAILSKANVRAPPRKNEMIAKIRADTDVYNVYAALYPAHQPVPVPVPVPEPQPQPELPKTLDEAEKRRMRAERFGIPLVLAPPNDPSKLAARATRFGTSQSVDSEEEEKRKRRAERFATKPSAA